jgi:hypothetical protein
VFASAAFVLMIIVLVVAIPIGFAAAIYLEKFAAVSRDQLTSSALLRQRRLVIAPEHLELIFDLFAHAAAPGALLLTYHSQDGLRLNRKVRR